jgi:uncharacterized membrane protein YvbJ
MMFCRNCGTELPVDSRFCPKCGFANKNKTIYNSSCNENNVNRVRENEAHDRIWLYQLIFSLVISFFILSVYFNVIVINNRLVRQPQNIILKWVGEK